MWCCIKGKNQEARYFTAQFDDLSFLSSQPVQLFEKSQASNGSSGAASRIARLQSERKELLQEIEYLEAKAEQTTSAREKRTLLRKVEGLSADLLALERRLKEADVELGYSATASRPASSGIQAMGTQLIEFGSEFLSKLR